MDEKAVRNALKDPENSDWSKLDPKDVGVSFGPMMTYEQMMAFCKKNGMGTPSIVKSPSDKKSTP